MMKHLLSILAVTAAFVFSPLIHAEIVDPGYAIHGFYRNATQ